MKPTFKPGIKIFGTFLFVGALASQVLHWTLSEEVFKLESAVSVSVYLTILGVGVAKKAKGLRGIRPPIV